MNRKEIIAFANREIFPQVKVEMDKADMIETIRLIGAWRMGKQIDVVMEPKVVDGFLFINGDPVGRIARKMPAPYYSERAYRLEGLILAREEEKEDWR